VSAFAALEACRLSVYSDCRYAEQDCLSEAAAVGTCVREGDECP